jgi:hypothetical protein
MLFTEKKVTDEMIQEKIRELKTKHPVFASVLEYIHQMDVKETLLAIVDGFRTLLAIHAARLASQ